MTSTELLSQDEIDSLLHGVGDGSVDTRPPPAPGEARLFDLATQDRIVRGRLPMLDLVNERFLRLWRAGLSEMLQRAVRMSLAGVETMKFTDYVHSLQVPNNVELLRLKPLRGTALLLLEPRLVFAVVDSFFGGAGRFAAPAESREATPTEQRVTQMALARIHRDLAEAWSPLLPIEPEGVGTEINPHLINVIAPRDPVVVTRIQVDLDGAGGQFHVTLPSAMLEQVTDLGGSPRSDEAERNLTLERTLRERLLDARIEASATLACIDSTVRQLLSLRVGDVLPLEMPNRLALEIEEVPLFEGEYGIANGRRAIRICGPRTRESRRPTLSGVAKP